MSLEAIFVLPTSPSSSRRVEQKALLVFLRDIIEEVMGNRELTVQLLEANTVVFQEKEPILSDCSLDIGNQLLLYVLIII